MKNNPEELKLIYVHKVGYNTAGEGIYQFVFSKDPETIDYAIWCWDMTPACDNALPPTKEFYDATYALTTDKFDLFCLHEAVDRPYMHGYHNIHCLAYEDPDSENAPEVYDDYDNMFSDGGFKESSDEDAPLLVFHYRMSLEDVQDLLYERDIILKGKEFLQSKNIEIV